jgi:hypothetical protein
MINRRFMIVPPALPSGGHAEQLGQTSEDFLCLQLEMANMRVPLLIEPPIYLLASALSWADAPLAPACGAVRDLFASFLADRFAENPPRAQNGLARRFHIRRL